MNNFINNDMDSIYQYPYKVYKYIVQQDDEATRQVIIQYAKEHYKEDIRVDFLDEKIVNEIINLGVGAYLKKKEEIKTEYLRKQEEIKNEFGTF